MRRDSHNQNLICSLFCVFSLSFLGYLWSDLIPAPQRVTLNYFEYTTGDFSRLCIRALVRINNSVLCKKQGKEISRKVRGFFNISFCQLLSSRGWTERSPFLFLPCSIFCLFCDHKNILFILWVCRNHGDSGPCDDPFDVFLLHERGFWAPLFFY